MLNSLFHKLKQTFSNHVHIYTDRFQNSNNFGYALTDNKINNSVKLRPKTFIPYCELNAVKHAIQLKSIEQNKNFTIFYGSINTILSIQNSWRNDSIIQECQEFYII